MRSPSSYSRIDEGGEGCVLNEEHINAEFSEAVVMRTAEMDWQSSPSPRVWRKRLDLAGPLEQGRVTSIVRYDPLSKFHAHGHPDGEEILVLDGVFSDENGNFPAGAFLLNPDGFQHAPYSNEGCILFVKLRQYPGMSRKQVTINMLDEQWKNMGTGASSLTLYAEDGYPERILMTRLDIDSHLTIPSKSGGAELFLLSGTLEDQAGHYSTGDWLRWPAQEERTFAAVDPVTVYVKTGHLPS